MGFDGFWSSTLKVKVNRPAWYQKTGIFRRICSMRYRNGWKWKSSTACITPFTSGHNRVTSLRSGALVEVLRQGAGRARRNIQTISMRGIEKIQHTNVQMPRISPTNLLHGQIESRSGLDNVRGKAQIVRQRGDDNHVSCDDVTQKIKHYKEIQSRPHFSKEISVVPSGSEEVIQ